MIENAVTVISQLSVSKKVVTSFVSYRVERHNLPWKLGLASGFVAQQSCMRLRNPVQADGRQRGTAPRSGRTPFTTFTMICRILFSPGKKTIIYLSFITGFSHNVMM